MNQLGFSFCFWHLKVKPALDGGDFVFAHDDFLVGGGGHVNEHLAEEIGGELLDGSGADDELTDNITCSVPL